MNVEWVAEIHRSRRAGCEFDLVMFRRKETVGGELPERRAGLTIGKQFPRNGRM
jgi:hypothetical protein